MERRADRALPTISTGDNRWLKTMPIFLFIVVSSTLAIFNYQKQSSSVVSSTLYALRTNEEARRYVQYTQQNIHTISLMTMTRILGDEIYFASQIPWISGELNQLHGRIDISFWVKGKKAKGLMRFKSERKTRMGMFETLEWSLQPEGMEEKISLLDGSERDPALNQKGETVKG